MRFPLVFTLLAACIKVPSTTAPGQVDPVEGAVTCVALGIAADVSPAAFEAAASFHVAVATGAREASFPAVDFDFSDCVPPGGIVAPVEEIAKWETLINTGLATVGLLALSVDTGDECRNAWVGAVAPWVADLGKVVTGILGTGKTAGSIAARPIDFSVCE